MVQDITEQKKAQEEIEAGRQRLEDIMENIVEGVGVADVTGRIIQVNKSFVEMHGYSSPDELVGKTFFDIVAKEVLPRIVERFNEMKRKKEKTIKNLEGINLRKDGSKFAVAINIANLWDENGDRVGNIAVIRDITEHKRMEEAVRESEERYRTLAEAAQDIIFIINRNDNVQYINNFGAQSIGRLPEEIIGKPRKEFFPSEVSARQKFYLQKVFETGESVYAESKIPLQGSEVWLGTKLVPIRDKTGEVNAVLGISRDNTQRKRAEEALQRSEERYRALFDQSPAGVFLYDRDLYITQCNERLVQMMQSSHDKLIGFDLHTLKDQSILPPLRSVLKGQASHHEGCYESTTGTAQLFASWRFAPLCDAQGDIAGGIGVVEDITEHKKYEEMSLKNEHLASISKAKSEFLASMSHELRTPLNSIIGFSELLKHKMAGELKEKQEHYVDNVLTSSKHLLSLINDILDLSKVEAGRIELVMEKFSVPETINETLTLIKEKAAKHNVIIKKEIDPKLEIEADKQRFKQILFNLLDNAVKFSKKEGGIVTIIAKKEGNMAKLSVSDTGIGIREEDMRRLFKEFEQHDSGISRKYGGTGLGLAITKKLVELHRGKIMAESKYGEGSTFTFLLPIKVKKGKEDK